jgi:acyl-CoA thioesterase
LIFNTNEKINTKKNYPKILSNVNLTQVQFSNKWNCGMTPLERAKKSAEIMWKRDKASRGVDMKIERISLGEADLSLIVKSKYLNGHGTCHGGFIFCLADSAFAFACNSYNQVAVAQNCMITFIMPAKKGEKLIAKAREVSRTGRSGIYDVSVFNEKKQKIAEFRGLSRTIGGQIFKE